MATLLWTAAVLSLLFWLVFGWALGITLVNDNPVLSAIQSRNAALSAERLKLRANILRAIFFIIGLGGLLVFWPLNQHYDLPAILNTGIMSALACIVFGAATGVITALVSRRVVNHH